ncbi:hypothetical protein M1E25_02215 [Streptomyces sp. MTZ3.1]|uniref:Integral membrane protein n=1 Tax=Streptomyces meridianus TaxID=2938945 RepID=A0ABT0X0T6_9ACTN|nr:hypothetical protein [Streptomyces meridianus]
MIWQTLGSALIGIALSYAGLRWAPERLPSRLLVLGTGLVAALSGGLLTHGMMGPGHGPAALAGSLALGVALLSLLIRPAARTRSATI